MQQDLFNGSYSVPVLTLDEIKSCDFDFFAHNPNIVSDVYSNTLDRFDNKKEVPFYHLYTSYNSVIRNKEYRFVVIKVGNNHWLYKYKVVHIVTTRQIRFFCVPETDGSYKDDELLEIISALCSLSFVRFVFPKSKIPVFNKIICEHKEISRLWNCDEFFYHIEKNNHNFTSNKWRKKHYVNLLCRNSDFTFDVSSSINVYETNKLRDIRKVGMRKKNDNVRTSTERQFQLFIRNIDKGTFQVISLRYKGELIAQEIFLLDAPRRVCQSLYCIHIFEYGEDLILKHLEVENLHAQIFV